MTADLIVTNGRIYTLDPAHPWAAALACRDGRVLALGSAEDMLALAGPGTQRLDVGGKVILPGLTDSHVHFLEVARRRQQVDLFGVSDFAEVRRLVREAAAQARPGQWILGWGWDENLWDVAPQAHHLDDLSPENPVALARMDMHTWWVNSRALALAGIDEALVDPPDSKIERDENGRPTGLLREWNALALVQQVMPETDEATLLDWLRAAQADAHRLGLTGIHDQRVEREGRQSLRLLQALRRRGELTLRFHVNIAADFVDEAAALGLQPGFGDEHLWLGHVKAFADGTMGSRTAAMLDPFEGEPGNTGVTVTTADALWNIAGRAAAAGFAMSVHAIGDRAVREVLDVLSERAVADVAAPLPMPHRIEHVQLIAEQDLPRLAQNGIVAAVQPVHLQTDWPTADRVWGRRARLAYAFRALLDQGTLLAFGSDAPVAPLNPFLGIQAALTRQDVDGRPAGGWYPEQRLTLHEALFGYTMAPALLAGKSAVSGSLSPGKWADFILLQQDIFAAPPADIGATTVAMTFVDGKLVYAA
jgi:predicted amidohydrolase YtcJ